ncbi:hypothetical protein [Methyloraptor flagellatus]|uniref:Uncharacterized protein n=1 Tax=Methyloraptor flagellatus TaxID=3162530 RepID=A0AAU7XDN7_9HYPH
MALVLEIGGVSAAPQDLEITPRGHRLGPGCDLVRDCLDPSNDKAAYRMARGPSFFGPAYSASAPGKQDDSPMKRRPRVPRMAPVPDRAMLRRRATNRPDDPGLEATAASVHLKVEGCGRGRKTTAPTSVAAARRDVRAGSGKARSECLTPNGNDLRDQEREREFIA